MTEESLLSYLPDHWKICFGVLMTIISFLATVENGIVLLTIFNYQVLHTTTNKILSSLALSDFLTGATVALLFSLQLLNEKCLQSATIDLVRRYLTTLFVGASVATLVFISYDRWLHLRLLNNYKMKRKKLAFTLILCWLIPLLLPLLRKVDASETVYSAVVVLLLIILLVGIAFCYSMIWMALRQRQQSETVTMIYDGERRAVKTVFVILTVFAVTIIPICIHHTLSMCKAVSTAELAKSYIIGQTLSLANSTINPVIYYFRTPGLKRQIQRLTGWNSIAGIIRRITERSKVDVQTV